MAERNIEFVVSRLPQFVMVTLRGPVTQATLMECPPDGEWLGIRFRPGTYFPRLPTSALLDRQDLNLPVQRDERFWFSGLSWEIPTFDNAEDFVIRLARAGVIARNHLIDVAIAGDDGLMSRRSVQRHFLRTTGMTLGSFKQIDRARFAASLLTSGYSILDTTFEAGYFDQAHLTRSMKQLVGVTPAKLINDRPQLSFSYKTESS